MHRAVLVVFASFLTASLQGMEAAFASALEKKNAHGFVLTTDSSYSQCPTEYKLEVSKCQFQAHQGERWPG